MRSLTGGHRRRGWVLREVAVSVDAPRAVIAQTCTPAQWEPPARGATCA